MVIHSVAVYVRYSLSLSPSLSLALSLSLSLLLSVSVVLEGHGVRGGYWGYYGFYLRMQAVQTRALGMCLKF